jgi:putative transposase
MRPSQFTLTSRQVHGLAHVLLLDSLRLADHGVKATAVTLLRVLLWAAARLASLAAACQALADAPSDSACRNALLATLPGFDELQRRLNVCLRGGLPRLLRKGRHAIAIDLTLLPYYGDPATPRLYTGQHKAGTRRSFAYATAYVISKGLRYTLALLAVGHSDPWDGVVKTLMRRARRAGVAVRYLLLDRGFYSVDVARYLQASRTPFVMPLIRRGRKADHPKGPSGTNVFFSWARGGWGEYVMESKSGRRARVSVCVYRGTRETRHGAGRRVTWAYAVWGLPGATTRWVVETYRKRFGIESSYRQMNQGRIRTSTKEPLLRLLYVGLALILRNVYVWLHWEVLSKKRRGRRLVDLDQLPLEAMLRWIADVAEEGLGLRTERRSQRPVPLSIT